MLGALVGALVLALAGGETFWIGVGAGIGLVVATALSLGLGTDQA